MTQCAALVRLAGYICFCALFATPAKADGGVVLFQRRWASLVITLFADPGPVRCRRRESFSALVESDQGDPISGPRTMLRLTHTGVPEILVPLVPGVATNRLLPSAVIELPEPGNWEARITVSSAAFQGDARGEFAVLPAESPWRDNWPYIALVPTAILVYCVNRVLKRRNISRRFAP